LPEGSIRFIEADLDDVGHLADAMRGCAAVIHLAAIPAPYGHPDDVVFRNNVLATWSVLQAASHMGIRRVAFASSGSIYGTAWAPQRHFYRWAPVDESYPLRIHDVYALGKAIDETTAHMFARRDQMTIAALRFHWIAT